MIKTETPQVQHNPGDVLHGFHVDAVTPLPGMRMVVYQLTHCGSGARLVHLHCHDGENLFAIVLRTPPTDDAGLPHILEHTVLCGSRRYPVKDPFVELLKTSLATFLNAFTGPDHTAYPCASMNEKDFFNLVGVYCDAVFHPRITREHFKQEGHHFSFETAGDITSPLTINGIVYNEMKGAFSSLNGVICRELGRHLFPDNAYGRESGGDPEHIPSLTYDQFIEFHRAYYHPSNARIVIHGNIPTARHLAFLNDHYLDGVAARPLDTAIGPQPRWSAPRRATIPYPIGADEDPARRTAVTMSFFTNAATDVATDLAMNVLDYYLLGNAASPLRKALIDSDLGEELTPSGYSGQQRDAYFTVGLKGTEPKHADAIVNLVRATLERIVRQGLDREKLDAAFHQFELAAREQVCSSPLHYMSLVMKGWLYDVPPVLHLQLDEHLAALRRRGEQEHGYFERIVSEAMLENNHCSVLTFTPDTGFAARQTREFTSRMGVVKASMTEDDLHRIAAETEALDAMQAAPNTPEALATLPRLSLADVPPESTELPTVSTDVAGVPVLVTDVFANGVNYIECAFDLRGLPEDLYDCLALYAEAIRKMGAGSSDYAAMAEREAACSGGVYTQLSFDGRVDDPHCVQPMLIVGCSALDRTFDDMLAMLSDRMFACDCSDRKRLRDVVLQRRVNLQNALVASSTGFARRRAARCQSHNARLQERVTGLEGMNILIAFAKRFDRAADQICSKLERIREFLRHRSNMTVSFVGDVPRQKRMEAWVAGLAGHMRRESAPAEMKAAAHIRQHVREGIIIPSAVASVAVVLDVAHIAPADTAVLFMLSTHLSYGYLWETVRVRGGAYGVHASFELGNGRFVFSSSQDPHVKDTINAFARTADYLGREMDLSVQGVEQALIGSFKKLDYPVRGGDACSTALARLINGTTPVFRQEFRERIRSVTAADVRRVNADIIEPALRAADTCVMASREKFEAENIALGADALPLLDAAAV